MGLFFECDNCHKKMAAESVVLEVRPVRLDAQIGAVQKDIIESALFCCNKCVAEYYSDSGAMETLKYGIVYGRINKFLRSSGRRGKEFTVQQIAEGVCFSPEEVKSAIEKVLKDERLSVGGPPIIKGEKDGSYCCRTKYLDEITI